VPLLRALSGHSAMTYLALVVPAVFHLALFRTAAGLRIRAVGEKPLAATTLGISVSRLRYPTVIGGGLLAGLGGAAFFPPALVRFEQHMPAGLRLLPPPAEVVVRRAPPGASGAPAVLARG